MEEEDRRGGEAVDRPDAPGVHLPPEACIQLVCGWRSREALAAVCPDLFVAPEWARLVDTLFPVREGFLYTID